MSPELEPKTSRAWRFWKTAVGFQGEKRFGTCFFFFLGEIQIVAKRKGTCCGLFISVLNDFLVRNIPCLNPETWAGQSLYSFFWYKHPDIGRALGKNLGPGPVDLFFYPAVPKKIIEACGAVLVPEAQANPVGELPARTQS